MLSFSCSSFFRSISSSFLFLFSFKKKEEEEEYIDAVSRAFGARMCPPTLLIKGPDKGQSTCSKMTQHSYRSGRVNNVTSAPLF